MNITHKIVECKNCHKIIAQCRCANPHKEKEYQLCEDCKAAVISPDGSMPEPDWHNS